MLRYAKYSNLSVPAVTSIKSWRRVFYVVFVDCRLQR